MTAGPNQSDIIIEPRAGEHKGDPIKGALNPDEYTRKKKVDVSEQTSHLPSPPVQQTGIKADILEITLLFVAESGKDVKKEYISDLYDLLEPTRQTHGLPPVRVVMGSGLKFRGLLIEADVRYTHFGDECRRTRAWAETKFIELRDLQSQKLHKKFQSTDKMKAWTVSEGDSLEHIAYEEYGDTRHWRTIADANKDKIKNPRKLTPGMQLKLPPL